MSCSNSDSIGAAVDLVDGSYSEKISIDNQPLPCQHSAMQCRIGAPMLIIPGKKFDMKSQLTRGARSRLMYVELKSGFSDNGPARIGRVTFSKSGLSVFYRGLELHRLSGRGVCGGNYFDEATGNEYWVSGLKKNGQDRHHCGRGEVLVDKDIRAEYVAFIEGSSCTK